MSHFATYDNLLALMPRLAAKIGSGGSGSGIADWTANTSYTTGQLLVHEGQLYKVTADFTSGTTFSDDNLETYIPNGLTQAQLDELIALIGGGGQSSIADWTSGTSYSVGQLVFYDGGIYKCITANNDTTFSPEKWEDKIVELSSYDEQDAIDDIVFNW